MNKAESECRTENIKERIEIFDPVIMLDEEDFSRRFRKGGILIYSLDYTEGCACAVKGYYEMQDVEDAQERTEALKKIDAIYPEYRIRYIQPAEKVCYLTSPRMYASADQFYTDEEIRKVIAKEEKYAGGDTVTLIVVEDNYSDCGTEKFVFYAYTTCAPYEVMSEVVEKFPFSVEFLNGTRFMRESDARIKKGAKDRDIRALQTFLQEEDSYEKLNAYLEERVLGQDELYKLAYNIHSWAEGVVAGKKTKRNTFLIAPSGSGKSEALRAIRDYFQPMGLKVVIADTSNITASGYKGTDPSELFRPFLQDNKTVPGILCLDELDKKTCPSYDSKGGDNNREVLSQLLVAIEGGTMMLDKKIALDTSQILIIAAGSFSHLREKRNEVKPLGFGAAEVTRSGLYDEFSTDELVQNSFAEFVGRFSTIVNMKQLTYKDFQVLLKKYLRELEVENNVKITISREYREELYESFLKSSLGCRGVFSEIWNELLPKLHAAKLHHKEKTTLQLKSRKKQAKGTAA